MTDQTPAVYLSHPPAALLRIANPLLAALLRTRLPDCIVVSVTHRTTVEQHHQHHLRLLGGGAWELDRRSDPVGV